MRFEARVTRLVVEAAGAAPSAHRPTEEAPCTQNARKVEVFYAEAAVLDLDLSVVFRHLVVDGLLLFRFLFCFGLPRKGTVSSRRL